MISFVNDVKNYPRCCSDFQKSAGGLKVGAPKPREERIPGKLIQLIVAVVVGAKRKVRERKVLTRKFLLLENPKTPIYTRPILTLPNLTTPSRAVFSMS